MAASFRDSARYSTRCVSLCAKGVAPVRSSTRRNDSSQQAGALPAKAHSNPRGIARKSDAKEKYP